MVAPKEYRSAHARRQRDIKRLLDSKQGTVPRMAWNERNLPQAQHQTHYEERETFTLNPGSAAG